MILDKYSKPRREPEAIWAAVAIAAVAIMILLFGSGCSGDTVIPVRACCFGGGLVVVGIWAVVAAWRMRQ